MRSRSDSRVVATLIVALGMLFSVPLAKGQDIFVEGKAPLLKQPVPGQSGTMHPAVQGGVQVWYTDLFRLRGLLGYQQSIAAGGALQVHPFRWERISPFGFAELKRFFANKQGNERSSVSVGLGLEYKVSNRMAVQAGVARQWNLTQIEGGKTDLGAGLTPRLGMSFSLSSAAAARPLSKKDERVQNAPSTTSKATPLASSSPSPSSAEGMSSPARQEEASHAPTVADMARVPMGEKKDMVRVPYGTFLMGLTDEDPLQLQQAGRKRVTVSSFFISKHEITNAEYRAFLEELSPSERQDMLPDSSVWQETGNRSNWQEYFREAAFSNYPVIGITYNQAQSYCQSQRKRLPTEAEWEYAARAGRVGGIYPWAGFEPRNAQGKYLANYNPGRGGYAADGYAFTAPVDAYPSNPWGLYNMSGNVAEWVKDAYTPSYSNISDFNPLYKDSNKSRRVVRGGSWASDAFYIGVGVRDTQEQSKASPYIGGRCAMDVQDMRQAAPGGAQDTSTRRQQP